LPVAKVYHRRRRTPSLAVTADEQRGEFVRRSAQVQDKETRN
jgi:hypothetical protein